MSIKYHEPGALPPGLLKKAEYVGRHMPLFTESADLFVLQHGKVLARFDNPRAELPDGNLAADQWHEFSRDDFRLDCDCGEPSFIASMINAVAVAIITVAALKACT